MFHHNVKRTEKSETGITFRTLQQTNTKIRISFPGTKWCGPGFIAKYFEDLGEKKELDKCCRAHDLCPQYIEPGRKKFGLRNFSLSTKSHCSCDEKLYRCLKGVQDGCAKGIGRLYFQFFNTKCFKKSSVCTGCAKRVSGRCVEYDVDKNSKQNFQWFDNPKF
ncbi:phospholipase A2-like [Zophobas morio]|uniref:phospholipase A2-like n=1 Tax=Zophobas morio TaxID=2755281 RepID=UPI003082EEB5